MGQASDAGLATAGGATESQKRRPQRSRCAPVLPAAGQTAGLACKAGWYRDGPSMLNGI